jgi:hypothetical protein
MPSELNPNDHQSNVPKKLPVSTTAFIPERLLDSDEAASNHEVPSENSAKTSS